MTVAAASTGASVPAQSYPLDAKLQAMVKQLPANQQAAALAQLQQLTPAQQQQVIAQATQTAAAQQGGAGTAATAPAAGASATADATTGAIAAKPPSRIATILKFVGIGAAGGAALGFGASFLTLPIVGQVAAPIAAAVGAGVGALVGLVFGMKSATKQETEFNEAQAAAAQAAVTTTPTPAGAEAPPAGTAKPGAKEQLPPSGHSQAKEHYTVVRGDTLSSIAKRHGITWQQLYAENKAAVGSNPNLIHPGLKLAFPNEGA